MEIILLARTNEHNNCYYIIVPDTAYGRKLEGIILLQSYIIGIIGVVLFFIWVLIKDILISVIGTRLNLNGTGTSFCRI